jgi:LuxR family transcriptional regulator, maltose regulon positive regulatory protein
MDDLDVTDLPVFVDEARLTQPVVRPDAVIRTGLLERLTANVGIPVVTVIGPGGYGKTTLLLQWDECDPRPFTWLTPDARDDDPAVFLSHLAWAVRKVVPVDGAVFRSLAAPFRSASAVLFRLLDALGELTEPAVLVVDDLQELRNVECQDALSMMVERLPGGLQVAIASREQPSLPAARLRAQGRILEFGAGELAMNDEEAGAVVQAAGVVLSNDEVRTLNRWAEGWPIALYVAAQGRALSTDSDMHLGRPPYQNRDLTEYLRSEMLSGVSASTVDFLTRTSVLERLSGPLCDAVLETSGSAAQLARLERQNLLVVPLDHERHWYRYHALLRYHLLKELDRREPELVPGLRRRAVDWYETSGMPDLAIDQAMELGDAPSVARIAMAWVQQFFHQGRSATVQRWCEWIDEQGLMEQHFRLAVLGAWVHLMSGHSAAAERWASAAEQGAGKTGESYGGTEIEGMLAMLRAAMCQHGLERMAKDADTAQRLLPPGSTWRPGALTAHGIARALTGEHEHADAILQRAVEVAEDSDAAVATVIALAERALLAMRRGETKEGSRLAERAYMVVVDAALGDYPPALLVFAILARTRLARGDVAGAKRLLAKGQVLRPYLTYIFPTYAVQARLELARCHIALTDVAGARTVLREADDIVRKRPHLGQLADEAAALRTQVEELPVDLAGAFSLTDAELRLLPLLATHHSFRAIGERLSISANTVKTEAMAIYRKLGVASRSEAVDLARDLGLLTG